MTTTTNELQKMDKPKAGDNTFRLTMPIEKSYTKEIDGRTVRFIGGIASGTDLDYDGERMAKSAIEAFVKAVDEGYYLPDGKFTMIPLRSGHRKEWDDILGWISKAEMDSHNNLWIEAELADTSKAEDLYKTLTTVQSHGRPIQLGFSIGGTIRKAVRVWDEQTKKSIREIQEVALREISVVGSPAFPTAYVEALYKSVNWDEVPPSLEELTKETVMTLAPDDKKDEVIVKDNESVLPLKDTQADALDESTTKEASTQSTDASSDTVANDGNVAAKAATTAEVTTTDPQSTSESTEKANIYYTEDAKSLGELVNKLAADLADMQSIISGTTKAKVAETDTSNEVTKTENVEAADDTDRIVKAITAAFDSFTTTVITPLVADMQAVKSAVAEMGTESVDKSLAVRTAKEDEADAIEKFRTKVGGQRNPNIIGEAVRAAYARNGN